MKQYVLKNQFTCLFKALHPWMVFLLISSCSYIPFFGDDEPEEVVKEDNKKSDSPTKEASKDGKDGAAEKSGEESSGGGILSTITSILPVGESSESKEKQEDLKLQVARLMARVEDLSEQVISLQSRMVVLEKAVHLGVSPEGLTSKGKGRLQSSNAISRSNLSWREGGAPSHHASSPSVGERQSYSAPSRELSADGSGFLKDLEKAKNLFRNRQFGAAYVSFTSIDQTYSDQIKQGEPTYWIGRSWFALREYTSAKKYFENYVKRYPTSQHTPMAKVYIARIEHASGMMNSAAALLQDVIREHPNSSAADASRRLIAEYRDSL